MYLLYIVNLIEVGDIMVQNRITLTPQDILNKEFKEAYKNNEDIVNELNDEINEFLEG